MIKQPSFSNIIGRNKSLFELFFNILFVIKEAKHRTCKK